MLNHYELAWWLDYSPMACETWVQCQVESYQRLKKWYLMPPCLTLSIIRYESRVKWSNPGKGVPPSSTPWCSSYRKGSLQVTLIYRFNDEDVFVCILHNKQCPVWNYIYALFFSFGLFNGILTPHGLLNAKIWLIC